MANFMFDTNIFNRILDGYLSLELLNLKHNYYYTSIQHTELNDTCDPDRREKLLAILKLVDPNKINTKTVVIGVSQLDETELGCGEIYTKIHLFLEQKNSGHENNSKDALIAEAAIKDNIILVTNDKDLREAVEEVERKVLTIDQFKQFHNAFIQIKRNSSP